MHLDMWEIDDDLIYLYSLKEDGNDKRRYPPQENDINLEFRDLTFDELKSYIKRLYIPIPVQSKIINSIDVRPKNPRFSIRQFNNQVMLEVTVKNDYIQSSFNLRYELESGEYYLYYFDHNYEGLKSIGWFKSEVERIKREVQLDVYTYYYGFEKNFENEKLTIKDEFKVHVTFGDGDFSSEYPEYRVNFEKRKLEFYHLMQGHEIFAGII